MDRIKKQELLNKKAEKCRTMDSDKKQQLLNKNEAKYRTVDNDQKKDLIDKQINTIVIKVKIFTPVLSCSKRK